MKKKRSNFRKRGRGPFENIMGMPVFLNYWCRP